MDEEEEETRRCSCRTLLNPPSRRPQVPPSSTPNLSSTPPLPLPLPLPLDAAQLFFNPRAIKKSTSTFRTFWRSRDVEDSTRRRRVWSSSSMKFSILGRRRRGGWSKWRRRAEEDRMGMRGERSEEPSVSKRLGRIAVGKVGRRGRWVVGAFWRRF